MSFISPLPLARLRSVQTRSISPENFDGSVGGGAKATEGTGAAPGRDLGTGWKISPSVAVKPGETFTIADISGAGVINHIWVTTHTDHWRTLVLRAYWDGSEEPAVEVPYGDFFCNGWGVFAQVDSQMIAANPHGGFNSYWPMPFREGARLTIENTSNAEAVVYYQVTYELGGDHSEDAYFHAQWRRSDPLEEATPHVLLEGIEGQGHYVGTYIAWGVNSNGWWGEGEIKFYMDDDTEYPTIAGTGTEDYFGGAWNFDIPGEGYTAFTTPYLGMPQVIRPDGLYVSQQRFGMYRWHVADPIHFTKGLPKVDIQALGWKSAGRYKPLRDDIASTAFFYLDRPSTTRPSAPDFDSMEVFLGTGPGPHVPTGPASETPQD
ncbi:glycoside hydrolase family 172 protein [Brachybacterium timonense]|uniref:glycoside hydrolase family 172 protein n=1 Tax=Brachybacterium timonense TaxID=2050896 RepID=UPI000D0B9BE2|nr:glycoside hydrolase family 172 protein [Brachybacterium timonense]